MLVWARDRLKQNAACLTKKCENFALMTSFDLEDVDLGSPKLHHKEFLCGPTHPASFVFLALQVIECTQLSEYEGNEMNQFGASSSSQTKLNCL